MRWKRSAAMSKQDHRGVVERVLRPWRARTGTAGRGNRAGEGRG
jgi:hypothetical protein